MGKVLFIADASENYKKIVVFVDVHIFKWTSSFDFMAQIFKKSVILDATCILLICCNFQDCKLINFLTFT